MYTLWVRQVYSCTMAQCTLVNLSPHISQLLQISDVSVSLDRYNAIIDYRMSYFLKARTTFHLSHCAHMGYLSFISWHVKVNTFFALGPARYSIKPTKLLIAWQKTGHSGVPASSPKGIQMSHLLVWISRYSAENVPFESSWLNCCLLIKSTKLSIVCQGGCSPKIIESNP